MLTFPDLRHHQLAYVTTDLDEALRRLDTAFGFDRHFEINTLTNPNHPDQPGLRIALIRTGGTEFEVIQPLGYNDSVWSDPLPTTGEFALMFHHIAFTIDGTMKDYEEYRASFNELHHPIVNEGWSGDDARWFYTDERATLGHYVEHCWFSPDLIGYLKGHVPVLSRHT